MWASIAMAALLVARGEAAPLPVAPGRGLAIGPCTAEAAAPCWGRASAMTRFEAPLGSLLAPREVAVRLAWQDGALLVRAEGLEGEEAVEITLFAAVEPDPLESWTLRVAGGFHSVALPIPLEAGQLRAAQILLVEQLAGDVRAWNPSGPVDLIRPFPLAVVAGDPSPIRLSARSAEGGLLLDAGSGVDLQIHSWFEAVDEREKGGLVEWGERGPSPLQTSPLPEAGWVEVVGVKRDPGGAPLGVGAWRLHVQGAAGTAATGLGILPAPRWSRVLPGGAFRLGAGARVVAPPEWRVAGERLADELGRFLDRQIPVVAEGARPGDIEIRALGSSAPLPGGPLAPVVGKIARAPEAFVLSTGVSGAVVLAHDLHGALYGGQAMADLLLGGAATGRATVADSPDLPFRVLFHTIDLQRKNHLAPEDYQRFLRRALLRGRYNALVLDLRGSITWPGHPELEGRFPITDAEFALIKQEATDLGIELIPALALPGDADWITRAHPELEEDRKSALLCTRNPGTRPLVTDLVDRLIGLFGPSRYFDITHDGVLWLGHTRMEEERCPRCAGTPPARLLGEELGWLIDMLEARGLAPIAWADIFTPGLDGGREGAANSLDQLSEAQRARLVMMTSTRRGRGERVLLREGSTVIRGHEGYRDAERGGLGAIERRLAGEGLRVEIPAPWSSFGSEIGRRALDQHWTAVVLAGATAWRAALDEVRITDLLEELVHHPAMRPGREPIPGWGRRTRVLGIEGEGQAPATRWPREADVDELHFGALGPHVARAGQPLAIPVKGAVAGLSILQASVIETSAEAALRASLMLSSTLEAEPVARLMVRWADGERVEIPLQPGLDTGPFVVRDRGVALWRTAATLELQSPDMAALDPQGFDRRLFRLDWVNPRPEVSVEEVEIKVAREGVLLVVGGALALLPE